MEEKANTDNKTYKILSICLATCLVLIIIAIGGYFIHEKYQEQQEKQKQELIVNTQEQVEVINSQISMLILSEEEQNEIHMNIEKIEKSIENKNITEEITNTIDTIKSRIEEIKINNISLLEQKENESNQINIDKFNEGQKVKITELQNQYTDLKNNGKYKEAQTKIQEIIDNKNNTNAEIAKAEEEEKARQEAEKKKQTSNTSSSYSNKNNSNNSSSSSTIQQQQQPTQATSTKPPKPTAMTASFNPNYTVTNYGGDYVIKCTGVLKNTNTYYKLLDANVIVTITDANNGAIVGTMSDRAPQGYLEPNGSYAVSMTYYADKEATSGNFTYSIKYNGSYFEY